MIYFTADTHLSHDAIRRYSNRPFPDIQTMNETIIKNWNNIVKYNDQVYHLGDVGFANPRDLVDILGQLNGKIYLIKGNHDKSALDNKCKNRFEWIKDYYKLKLNYNNVDVVICMMHYPIARWDMMHYGSFHLHGHSHSGYKTVGKILDVGVDNPLCNYTPFSLDQVIQYMSQREIFKGVDDKNI